MYPNLVFLTAASMVLCDGGHQLAEKGGFGPAAGSVVVWEGIAFGGKYRLLVDFAILLTKQEAGSRSKMLPQINAIIPAVSPIMWSVDSA
jgi:hypothetical protein